MDSVQREARTYNARCGVLLVAVLFVLAASVTLQLVALGDDGDVALARAAQAAVNGLGPSL